MGQTSGVKITMSNSSGMTPTGVSITYALGSVPVAMVDIAPAGAGELQVKSLPQLTQAEKLKRTVDVDLTISVDVVGPTGVDTRKLKFSGMFDGLSVSNSVGGLGYQISLKGSPQVLQELTLAMPGVYPMCANPYRLTGYSVETENKGNIPGVVGWGLLGHDKVGPHVFQQQPILFYKDLLIRLLEFQLNEVENFLGVDTLGGQQKKLMAVFKDPRYKKALQRGIKILKQLDVSAITGGTLDNISASGVIADQLKGMFNEGPTTILENLLSFLGSVGCTLIFANEKPYVVPLHSVIKQQPPKGGLTTTTTNVAQPFDYLNYSYNDTGFRDIAHVLIMGSNAMAGKSFNVKEDTSLLGSYTDTQLSQASGVYIATAHPWVQFARTSPSAAEAKELKQRMDNKKDALCKAADGGFDAICSQVLKQSKEEAERQAKQAEKQAGGLQYPNLDDYAKTKFYQMRYGDRRGSVTTIFSPKWVPGTSGLLYLGSTDSWLVFYVESVTHQLQVGAPASGTATTTISFSCGRTFGGASAPGVDRDAFLGYNRTKEKAIQESFISTIGA